VRAGCPDVFRFDEDGELRYDAVVPDHLRADVEEAALACPTTAITLSETNGTAGERA
jgi:ferredoxin